MAISLEDALGISEVKLLGQSVVAFNYMVCRLCQNVSGYKGRIACLEIVKSGFWCKNNHF